MSHLRELIRKDLGRGRQLMDHDISIFHPSLLAVILYRISSFCFLKKWTWSARVVWHINFHLTGADLSPASKIGPGLVIVHPNAVTFYGQAGDDLTIVGLGGCGGGLLKKDIGAGMGLPVFGNRVYLEMGAAVLGPVKIGHDVYVEANCLVTKDLSDKSRVQSFQPICLSNSAD